MKKMDHSKGSFDEALGISAERGNEIEALVLFHILDQDFLQGSLFDNIEECPYNLKTKSGCLESILEECETEEERIFATWDYAKKDILADRDIKAKMMMFALMEEYKSMGGDKDKFVGFWVEQKNIAGNM
jgi:hypothetical protein